MVIEVGVGIIRRARPSSSCPSLSSLNGPRTKHPMGRQRLAHAIQDPQMTPRESPSTQSIVWISRLESLNPAACRRQGQVYRPLPWSCFGSVGRGAGRRSRRNYFFDHRHHLARSKTQSKQDVHADPKISVVCADSFFLVYPRLKHPSTNTRPRVATAVRRL